MPFRKIKDVMRIIRGSAQAIEEPLEPFVEYSPPQPRGRAIVPMEVGETLEGYFEDTVPPVADEPLRCFCGRKMEVVDIDAWGVNNDEVRMLGVYSCPESGCEGNLKERHEKFLAAMNKLTVEEKKMLRLWNYNSPKNSMDVAAHLP